MAPEKRERPADLTTHYDQFASHPKRYHIFLALRVLEAELQNGRPLGRTRLPKDDVVRLGQDPELSYQRSTITDFSPATDHDPAQLRNVFFGFWGPHGPMPLHLTEYVRDRARNHKDPTLMRFTDMFTHRFMSLLYRAWADANPTVGLDQGRGGLFEEKVAAVAGFAGSGLQNRDAMPDLAKRYFAGLLSQGPKTAEALAQILSAFFKAPVEIIEFVGSWLELEPDQGWRLGTGALGRDTVIGNRVWSRSSKVRIRIGPLDREAYDRMLPGGDALQRLAAIVHNFAGLTLEFDVNLILRASDVPSSDLKGGTRLGQTSWLGTRKNKGDAADLIVALPDETHFRRPPRAATGI